MSNFNKANYDQRIVKARIAEPMVYAIALVKSWTVPQLFITQNRTMVRKFLAISKESPKGKVINVRWGSDQYI